MDSGNTGLSSLGEIQTFLKTILFVIVVYRQRIRDSEAWTSLESEIASLQGQTNLLIYDNSPLPQDVPDSQRIHIHYHHNPSNAGVSAAYNFGNDLSIKQGKRWLFLLDQDTKWLPGVLLSFFDSLKEYPHGLIFAPIVKDTKGIISPFVVQFGQGARIKSTPRGPVLLKKYMVINSGMMINVVAFQKAGGYENALPLDFSDIFFLTKFQKVSQELIVVNAELQHNLSDSLPLDYRRAMDRFRIYCRATQTMSDITGKNILFWSRSLLRGLHLSWRYGRLSFVEIHSQTWHKSA